MQRVIEHMRFGPLMVSCDRSGIANILHKRLVRPRSGDFRDLTVCSGCLKEVISDENIEGFYSSRKPHVPGYMFTAGPEIVYYPVRRSHSLVYAILLNNRIPEDTRAAVSECIEDGIRLANSRKYG